MKLAICVFVFGLSIASAAENPIRLYSGLGSWHHPIATKSSEAQKFFDQGLTLVYSFNRYEALRSFRRAAELDPDAAMAYWGMAMAQGPYINMDGDPSFDLKSACAATDAGLKITSAPDRERAYLRAVSTWCPEYRPEAYSKAMQQLAQEYPDDLDAMTLYADSLLIPVRWHWYEANGTAAPGVADAERVLEQVMRRWPQHPGANHYYIHAVESSRSPERAIASAQRLMGVVPEAGHMVHMPAHIWLLFGDWETAATLNQRAAAVDREYFAASHAMGGTYSPYYAHNLHFVLYARSMQGRRADTFAAADALTAGVQPMARTMPEMTDVFSSIPALMYVRFGEWDRILALPAPPEAALASRATWLYARTVAFAARGDRTAAEERSKFDTLRRNISADAPWGQNKARNVLEMASTILAARLAATPQEAGAHWEHAVNLQDHFVYDEPPAWYYPVRESQGAALLRAGNAAAAETVFREGVRRSPRNGRMLFGLMESLKAQGKQQDAEFVKREFEANWAKADIRLELEDF